MDGDLHLRWRNGQLESSKDLPKILQLVKNRKWVRSQYPDICIVHYAFSYPNAFTKLIQIFPHRFALMEDKGLLLVSMKIKSCCLSLYTSISISVIELEIERIEIKMIRSREISPPHSS